MTYEKDFRNDIAVSWPSVIDDSLARKDWNWNHEYDLRKTTIEMLKGNFFIKFLIFCLCN